MGLDMYLNCNDRELVHKVHQNKAMARRGIIIYWRKANMIHQWLIDNAECGCGIDNCVNVSISVDDLKRLKETCDEVLKDHNKASQLLPTQDGVFFGSLEYDEYYFEEVEKTATDIGKILELIKPAKSLDGFNYMSWEYVYKHNDWVLDFSYYPSW